MKPRHILTRLLAAAVAAGIATTGLAADVAPPKVDPNVIAALERMGSYLRTLDNFEIGISSVTDELIATDQTAQYSSASNLKVRRPDGLQVDSTTDRGDRRIIYYNGKTATVYGPASKYYATFPAPPTLKDLAEVLASKYGIDVPLSDLFYWGTDKMDRARIAAAGYLGDVDVNGTSTSHYAIREKGVDWQIWIERGDRPLPRKLVITTLSTAARPQYAAVLGWKLAPEFAADTFDFVPPADAHRIAIRTRDGKVEN